MFQFRAACYEGERELLEVLGFPVRLWPRRSPQGAGSIASEALASLNFPRRREGVPKQKRKKDSEGDGGEKKPERQYYCRAPREFERMVDAAYYGGRFEISACAKIETMNVWKAFKLL
jgi:hypothetical protein